MIAFIMALVYMALFQLHQLDVSLGLIKFGLEVIYVLHYV